MCLQSPCLIPVVFVSPLHWCRAHTHLYISMSRTCVPICPTTVICLCFTRVSRLVSCKSCVFPFHLDVVARLLTDLETRRFGILLFHTSLSPSLVCLLHVLPQAVLLVHLLNCLHQFPFHILAILFKVLALRIAQTSILVCRFLCSSSLSKSRSNCRRKPADDSVIVQLVEPIIEATRWNIAE